VDVDSTICEVHGYRKQGAAYGYTRVLGHHPLLATRADTGEVLHARLRKGSANTARGIVRFVEELLARLERAGGADALIVRADSGFYQDRLLDRLSRAKVGYSVAIPQRAPSAPRSTPFPSGRGSASTTPTAMPRWPSASSGDGG
jgi:hypothetical protein